MMRSEKCCGCLPAYGVSRSDFIAQLLPDSKYVCKKILALAPQNSFAFVMYVVNESITTVS